jgi:uncharacterized protein (DUF4415 family)
MKNSSDTMHEKYSDMNFSDAKPASDIPALAKLQAESGRKTRITMRIDNDVLAVFKVRAEMTGGNYQTLINEALKQVAAGQTLADVVRETIRQELNAA